MTQARIGFIGVGQMATALATGFIQNGGLAATNIFGYSPTARSREQFEIATGASTLTDNRAVIDSSDIVFLCTKPQMTQPVFDQLALEPSESMLYVSVVAGLRCDRIAEGFRCSRVMRVLPTTPCLIGQGIAALAAGSKTNEKDLADVEVLLSTVATTYRMSETALDAVTGMANPAYVLKFIESMADGGVLAGLRRDIALDLAARTVMGSAAMVIETGEHPSVLRDRVTSPAGTTIAGLRALEEGRFGGTVIRAVEAGTTRSRELGGQ